MLSADGRQAPLLALLRTALRVWPDNGDGIYLRLPSLRNGFRCRREQDGVRRGEAE